MKIKVTPEDFQVVELARLAPARAGRVSLYELHKRKIGTFEAVRQIARRAGVPQDRLGFLGLKDRQALTTQLVWADGVRLPLRLGLRDIRLRYLGRAAAPPPPETLRGNRFTVVVRDLDSGDLADLEGRRARLRRYGLVNYYDDQRFGSLAAGQGLPGRELVRGNHEAVLRALLAAAGRRDPPGERRFKHFVARAWGDWPVIAARWGHRPGLAMVRHLARHPQDFAGALTHLPARERALHVFAYQSWIWNESVAAYLVRKLPAGLRSATPYVGGRHVWIEPDPAAALPPLARSFPLLDHTVAPADPEVRRAIASVLAREGLTIERLRIDGIPGCFLQREERRLRLRPAALRFLGPALPDERHPGRHKLTVAFDLPRGTYATLILKRLFSAAPVRDPKP
ncbi:MAG: tRNA pseudouridine(13) synthase TruD [Planctomycetes bacterium]|nr:tRNA pseudouridine(13) synthase TruD [Planctomycetota bacterium]